MAKGSFTTNERLIWNSIYGASRGPSSGRLKILVEEFSRLGLEPAMMRIDAEMLPYDEAAFQVALKSSWDDKDDDLVQVYYHPVECEKVVGSSATTWVQWGRLILEVEGLIPKGVDDHPCLKENVPRLQLPTETRDVLESRGLTVASVCRLVSARAVSFFIAAQYEAWATPAEVAQVSPFKEVLRKTGFTVRDCDVRRDTGVDAIMAGLDDGAPAVRQPFNAPVAAGEVDGPQDVVHSPPAAGIAQVEEAVEEVEQAVAALEAGVPIEAGSGGVTANGDPAQDIDAAIALVEAQLKDLRRRREEARVAGIRKEFLAATVGDVRLDERGGLRSLMLKFPNGSFATYQVTLPVSDVDSILDDLA